MKKTWPLVQLGEVLRKSDDWITLQPEQTYREVTVRLWGKGVTLRREVLGAEIASDRRLRVKPGQFIASRIDARNGAFGLIPDELDGGVVTNDFPVFEPDKTRLHIPFLGWMSKTATFVDLCKAASEGTTNRVRLKEDRFLATSIHLPPFEEQRRIVAHINEVAEKREEARRLRQEVSESMDAIVASMHSWLAGGRFITLDMSLQLDEDRVSIKLDESYPQVGVRGFGGGLFAREVLGGNETTYKMFNRLYDGAIVLSQVKGWEGAIAACPPSLAGMFVSPEYRTFRCIPGQAIPAYMGALVSTPWFWKKLKDVTRGVGARRERTRPEQFLKMSIPMPTVEKQATGAAVFERLNAAKRQNAATEAELDALLPSVLDRAFKGEL